MSFLFPVQLKDRLHFSAESCIDMGSLECFGFWPTAAPWQLFMRITATSLLRRNFSLFGLLGKLPPGPRKSASLAGGRNGQVGGFRVNSLLCRETQVRPVHSGLRHTPFLCTSLSPTIWFS